MRKIKKHKQVELSKFDAPWGHTKALDPEADIIGKKLDFSTIDTEMAAYKSGFLRRNWLIISFLAVAITWLVALIVYAWFYMSYPQGAAFILLEMYVTFAGLLFISELVPVACWLIWRHEPSYRAEYWAKVIGDFARANKFYYGRKGRENYLFGNAAGKQLVISAENISMVVQQKSSVSEMYLAAEGIDGIRNNFSVKYYAVDWHHFAQDQAFELEGRFAKVYDVYMERKKEAEGLYILTPDVMHWLMENPTSIYIDGKTVSYSAKSKWFKFYPNYLKLKQFKSGLQKMIGAHTLLAGPLDKFSAANIADTDLHYKTTRIRRYSDTPGFIVLKNTARYLSWLWAVVVGVSTSIVIYMANSEGIGFTFKDYLGIAGMAASIGIVTGSVLGSVLYIVITELFGRAYSYMFYKTRGDIRDRY